MLLEVKSVVSVSKHYFRQTIWDLRVKELEARVLCCWDNFTIWNAGKQGRKFYR